MRVELTNEQVAERGRELATLVWKLVEARQDKKVAMRDWSQTITDLEKRILETTEVVRSGIEYRDDQQQLFEKEFENDRESLADHLERELQAHPIDGITEVSVSNGRRKRTLYKAKTVS